jgi:hypothetical protein
MGRLDEAREIVERLRAIAPLGANGFGARYRNPEHRELLRSGLRQAAGKAISLAPKFGQDFRFGRS